MSSTTGILCPAPSFARFTVPSETSVQHRKLRVDMLTSPIGPETLDFLHCLGNWGHCTGKPKRLRSIGRPERDPGLLAESNGRLTGHGRRY